MSKGLDVAEWSQVGMDAVHEIAGLRFRCDLSDFDMGMLEQQAQKLAADIAGAADDGNTKGGSHGMGRIWSTEWISGDGYRIFGIGYWLTDT